MAEPTLISVSPTTVPATNSQQTLKLYGSNFASDDALVFTFPDNTTGPNLNPITFVSSSEIDYTYFNDQNDAGPWEVQVKSPDGTLSSAVAFTVAATTYSISPDPASVNENGGTLTFTLTRSNSSTAATIYASTVQDQGYTNNNNYVGLNSQAVTFAAGQSQATVRVQINDLGLTSGSETYRFIVQQNA